MGTIVTEKEQIELANRILGKLGGKPIKTEKETIDDKVKQADDGKKAPEINRQEIRNAFRNWDGSPNPNQTEILKKYGR